MENTQTVESTPVVETSTAIVSTTEAANAGAKALTPAEGSSFQQTRKAKMAAWLEEGADETIGDPPSTETATSGAVAETGEQDKAALPTVPTPTGTTVQGEQAGQEPTNKESPTPQGADDPSTPPRDSQPQSPHSFSAKVGNDEWAPPAGLTLTYKADGQEVTKPLEEVVNLAKLGENFGRRSRDLAVEKRQFAEQAQESKTAAEQQIAEAWNQVYGTLTKIAEDPEYREQFLEEHARLKNNPAEIELRVKARKAEVLEQQLKQQRQEGAAEWNRKVWATVDEIIKDGTTGEKAQFPYADPARVRQRFHEAYSKHGKDALKEDFVTNLIREDHEQIAAVVRTEREKATAILEKEVAKARTQAAVETRNTIVDKSLQREQVARVVPAGTAAAADKAAPPIKSTNEASKRLKEWANS